jgi:hypothetical protein
VSRRQRDDQIAIYGRQRGSDKIANHSGLCFMAYPKPRWSTVSA